MLTGIDSDGEPNITALLGVLCVLAAVCLLASSPVAADSPGEDEINISVEPTETDVEPGTNVTYEVIVEGAQQGIEGYAHTDVVIENPEVGQFVDFYETANDNTEGNITFSLTEIQDMNGNQSETGPVLSMEAALTGGTDFDGADEHVIAEAEVEVLGSVPSATNVTIVKNPDPDPIDEPQIANSSGDAYAVNAIEDSTLTLPGSATLSLVPSDTELQPGETTTYEVVVEGAEYGIQSYDGVEITIEDSGTGQFVGFSETAEDNVDPGGEPPVSNSEIRSADGTPAQTGPVVWLEADLADGAFDGGQEVVIAELEAMATGFGTTPVTVADGSGVVDLGGIGYDITSTADSELDPVGIDVTGNGKPATDTTGNGLLNDVDGDGDFDIFDVQGFFNNFETTPVQNNATLFNFDGDSNNDVTIFDVQSLFNALTEG